MAGFPNKIIINAIQAKGTDSLVRNSLAALNLLGDEIIELDMLKETLDLEKRMDTICLKHREAELEYEKEINDLIIESRKRINTKKGLTGPTRIP